LGEKIRGVVLPAVAHADLDEAALALPILPKISARIPSSPFWE
jgi:hypothetical protein